jgi:hypothetical protein
MIPTHSEIKLMTTEQCQTALNDLEITYKIHEAWTNGPPPYADDVANALLWLEDRITYIRQLASLEIANAARKLNKE